MEKKESKIIKQGFGKVKSGNYIATKRKPGEIPRTLKLFGCQVCSWIGTRNCPHEILVGSHHSNWICSDRILYLKGELVKVGTVPRLIQNEMAIQLKMVTDKMLFEYSESGELHEEFKHINKNLISLIDKMRKQDEGIKLQGELTVTHEDFRKLVDTEAEKIEERNSRTRQAEFTEEVQDNR